jgi:hypothetical protein
MPIRCDCEKESGHARSSQYCGPCYRERERIAGRARHARFTPERRRAHVLVGCALAKGDLIPQPCELCGSRRYVEAHHDDYAQPLAVRWLCKRHHRQHHVKFGPGLNAYQREISA